MSAVQNALPDWLVADVVVALPSPYDAVPAALKAIPQWAPWRAVPSLRRAGKIDKVPQTLAGVNASTNADWHPFDEAVRAANEHGLAGVGINLRADVTAIDLDGVVALDGNIAPWARKIIEEANSYAEISPSGKGLRIMFAGRHSASDWTNHEAPEGGGIEVYAGHAARFVTVTGNKLPGTVDKLAQAPAGFLARLEAKYRKSEKAAPVADLPRPRLLNEAPALPEGLSGIARALLVDGDVAGDRSSALASATASLYARIKGDDRDSVVFSILANSPAVMEIARSHRRGDEQKALDYLWQHHCLRYRIDKPREGAQLDDFAANVAQGVAQDALAAGAEQTPADAKPEGKLFPVTVAKLYDAKTPRPFVIKGLAAPGRVIEVLGKPGASKTVLLVHTSKCIARGQPWFRQSTKRGAVVYVASEGRQDVLDRLAGYDVHHGVDPNEAPIFVLPRVSLSKNEDRDRLIATIRSLEQQHDVKIGAVLVDTLAASTDGDENDNSVMRDAALRARDVAEHCRLAVFVAHHPTKTDAKQSRGGGAWLGAIDQQLFVEKASSGFRLSPGKQRQLGLRVPVGYCIAEAVIGEWEDGDTITAPVLVESAVVAAEDRKLTPSSEKIWQRLCEVNEWPATKDTVEKAVRAVLHPSGETSRTTVKSAVDRALSQLLDTSRITGPEGGPWHRKFREPEGGEPAENRVSEAT